MAEEVGQGYVSVVPSMRNFSRLVKAELAKSFKDGQLEVAVKPVFDKSTLGKLTPITVPVTPDLGGSAAYRARLKALLAGSASQKVDLDIDRSVGQRIFSKIFGGSEVEVDRDRVRRSLQGLGGDAARAGTAAGQSFLATFTSAITSPSTGLLIAIAAPFLLAPTAIIAALATAGTVISAAGIGGLLLGGFALRNDPELRAALGGLGQSINKGFTEAAQPLKGPFLAAITTIGEAIRYVAPDIRAFFKTIADSGAIGELARGVGGFIKAFSDTGALSKLADAIGPMLLQIGMALPDIGNALSQFLISMNNISPQATDFMGKSLRGLADTIRFLGDTIEWLSGRWDDLKSTVKFFGDRISDTIYGLKLFHGALTGNAGAVATLAGAVGAFANWLRGKWGELWGWARERASSAIGDVVSTARGIPSRISAAVGDLGSLLWSAGSNLIQGLINGITSKLTSLKNTLSAVTNLIPNWKGPADVDRKLLVPSGQMLMSGLMAGIDSRVPQLQSQLAGITTSIGQRDLAATAAGGAGTTVNNSLTIQPRTANLTIAALEAYQRRMDVRHRTGRQS